MISLIAGLLGNVVVDATWGNAKRLEEYKRQKELLDTQYRQALTLGAEQRETILKSISEQKKVLEEKIRALSAERQALERTILQRAEIQKQTTEKFLKFGIIIVIVLVVVFALYFFVIRK